MLRAVLFDLDDTLVDQATASAAAVIDWAAELGVTDHDVAGRWVAVSARNYARYQRRELTFTEQRRERVRDFLGVTVDDVRADDLFAGYLSRYEAGWTVFDDAVPALRRTRAAGLVAAVFTNGDEEHQRFKLDSLGLSAEVGVLVASSMLPAGKPDPRSFAHALALVGVTRDEAVMVGNSLEQDVHGARDAGMAGVLLDRHGRHSGADVPRVRTLAELDFTIQGF
ncbi:MAG: HAD family hydrolase [Nocardioides sp.]|uniref:HAD family hydrolase n=1 Tax=Nocardioides sp. TaxID=35761 RepID=UPI0039E66BA4